MCWKVRSSVKFEFVGLLENLLKVSCIVHMKKENLQEKIFKSLNAQLSKLSGIVRTFIHTYIRLYVYMPPLF